MKALSFAREARRAARISAALALAAVLVSSLLSIAPVRALGPIVVDTTHGGLNTSDGDCSLAEAIGNAENDSSLYPECAVGAGADTIVFDDALGSATITLTAALPGTIDTDGLTIQGGGDITLDGANSYRVLSVSSPVTLDGLTVAHGTATVGGGLSLSIGPLTIIDSTFTDNHTAGADTIYYGGGAIYNNQAVLTIIGSTFSGNSTVAQGGAIYTYGGTIDISNSTFTSNSAAGGTAGNRGGAYYSFGTFPGAVTSVLNSTFSGNSSDSGSGADIHLRSEETLNLYNTILANSGSGGSCFSISSATGASNLIEDTSLACALANGVNGNIVGSDPGLGSFTGAPGYFPLTPTSLAIDAGANAHVPGSLTTDQAGNARFTNNALVSDTGTGTPPIVDIGSSEDQSNACPGSAQVYVDGDLSGGTHTGDSWANAFTDLQLGMLVDEGCPDSTATWVAEGVYIPGPTDNDSFNVPAGVAVYGGFDGSESTLGARDWKVHPTILSGDRDGDDDTNNSDGNWITEHYSEISGTNSTGVVVMVDVPPSTVLDGFIITGGQAHTGFQSGAGLTCDGSSGQDCSPTLANLLIVGNTANYGGGMWNYAYSGTSSPSLTDVAFVGNYADQDGGGLYNYGYFGHSDPALTRVTFESNDAGRGGAIGNFGAYGGSADPIIKNATFYDNSAATDGGAIHNRAVGAGGTASPELTNVTFSANSAAAGGAMYNFDETSGASSPVLVNTILWGDSAATGAEMQNAPGLLGTPTISYSVVEGGCGAISLAVCGAGNLSTDPNLGALADNGGETKTMAPGGGSSAIDTGTNTGCPTPDQRGVARPQGPLCDIGAAEVAQTMATLRSVGSQDGWILESSETSAKGGTLNSTATEFYVGDDAADKQYRAILSFNTGPTLPDTAVITSAVLKLKKTATVGGSNPFATLGYLYADIKQGPFSGNAALQLTDFYAAGSKNFAGKYTSAPTTWIAANLSASALPYVNRTGGTQLRLRFATDDNDNLLANYLKFASGNAITTSRPQLVITYYVP